MLVKVNAIGLASQLADASLKPIASLMSGEAAYDVWQKSYDFYFEMITNANDPHLRESIEGYFPITSICRDDLPVDEKTGEPIYDARQITDEMMMRLSEKMKDDYLTQLFHEHIPIIADALDFPKIKKEENE